MMGEMNFLHFCGYFFLKTLQWQVILEMNSVRVHAHLFLSAGELLNRVWYFDEFVCPCD